LKILFVEHKNRSFLIVIAMICGVIAGQVFGQRTAILGEFGKILIQFIKMWATPLLFFAILDAFITTNLRLKTGIRIVSLSAINGLGAMIIGLSLCHFLRPGDYLRHLAIDSGEAESLNSAQSIGFVKTIVGMIPKSFLQPFVDNEVISVVLLAIMLGVGFRKLKSQNPESFAVISKIVAGGFKVNEIIIGWIIDFIPIAVFGVVAHVVGKQGLEALASLGVYVGVILLGLFLHVVLVYHSWIKFVAKVGFRSFWSQARHPVAFVLGSSSSLATLPVTLKALSQMKVSNESARASVCVATNFNNDGILLYEVVASLMIAQIYGIEMGFQQQLALAGASVLASIGIAGVPEAGLITLSLVLTTVGLPTHLLPLFLSVDWICSRARATTNVIGDMTGAVVLDHWEKT
jgi:Na+/H+-dicarboxylate symporter